MRTVFDKATREELIRRIHTLSPADKALWGKMNIFQMLRHCTLSEEMLLGRTKYDRLFIGRLFGKMALRRILKDESPVKRNQPTHPALVIKTEGDAVAEQRKWIALMEQYADYRTAEFMHPFFGKMTRTEVGQFVYKHTDHHLRQFNR